MQSRVPLGPGKFHVVVLVYDSFAREFTATVSQSSSTFCSTLFLARLVSIRVVISLVSLLLFAFLSKRNGTPGNSADSPDYITFFLAI